MKHAILNGADMMTRADAYAQIWCALDCPEECSTNLDALWDVLTTTCAQVTLQNPAPMLNALGRYGCRMLEVFYTAAAETETFQFFVEA